MKTRILYVPLDDRDCNRKFPVTLGKMTDSLEVLIPPEEILGYLKEPADRDAVWNWLFAHAEEADYAILSVDTLLYGNIIGSRIHHFSEEECKRRLADFRRLKELNPGLHIHAFNLVARVAAYNDDHEDPDYWKDYGYDIWRYTCLLDKDSKKLATDEERAEAEILREKIPAEILKDFLDRRKVDLAVNLESVGLVKDGTFDMLTIPKDDTAPFGYAAMDQKIVSDKVIAEGLQNRVYIYPGADEAACVQLARIFCLTKDYHPAFYVRYSSVKGREVVPLYEDRPLGENFKWQITSAGGIVTETPADADAMLAVNVSGAGQIECRDQDSRTVEFRNQTNSEELLRYVEWYLAKYGKPVGICDVAMPNGCDNEFCANAAAHGIFDKITAFGGWNTAANTNGVVIAWMVIRSYYAADPGRAVSDTFLARAVTADWLCQANVLQWFLKSEAAARDIDPWFLKEREPEARAWFEENLRKLLKEKLSGRIKGKEVVLDDVHFNWDGAFYFGVDVRLAEPAMTGGKE